MRPYSQDLRQRILDTIQRGEGSLRQIARRFLLSVSFVTRLLRSHRATGSLEPQPHRGGNPAVLTPEDLERLRELIRQQPDATLEECRRRLNVSCSTMTISRALSRLGLPRKKKVPRAAEQDRPEVQEQLRAFCKELAGVDPRRLVFVDECGANTAMTRTYGRAPRGQRVYTNRCLPEFQEAVEVPRRRSKNPATMSQELEREVSRFATSRSILERSSAESPQKALECVEWNGATRRCSAECPPRVGCDAHADPATPRMPG
jgi:transposase